MNDQNLSNDDPEINEPIEGTDEPESQEPTQALTVIDERLPAMAQCMAGMQTIPLSDRANQILMAPLDPNIVEIRPVDGIPYVPQVHYRRVLNLAFGPGMWNMIPTSDTHFDDENQIMSREWAIFASGRFFGKGRGEQRYIESNKKTSMATTSEGVKSSGLKRCCKDMGIFWEISDPQWILRWKKEYAVRVWTNHATEKKDGKPAAKIQWRRKDRDIIDVYPWKETGLVDPVKPPPSNGAGKQTTTLTKPVATSEEKQDYKDIAKICTSLGVTGKGMTADQAHEARIGYINGLMGYQPYIGSMKNLNSPARKLLIDRLNFELRQANEVYEATL